MDREEIFKGVGDRWHVATWSDCGLPRRIVAVRPVHYQRLGQYCRHYRKRDKDQADSRSNSPALFPRIARDADRRNRKPLRGIVRQQSEKCGGPFAAELGKQPVGNWPRLVSHASQQPI